jgi:membrane protein YqaA with SNARE-associated domain
LFNQGSDAIDLLIIASIGNWLGSMTNYYIGSLGKWDWITKYLRIKKEKVEGTFKYVHKYDYFAASLCWLPILGTPIAIALGFMRSNLKLVAIFMFLGKFIRYLILWLILEGVLMI